MCVSLLCGLNMGNGHSQDVAPLNRPRTNLQESHAQIVGVIRVRLNIIMDEDIFSWAAYHQLSDHVAHILMTQGFRSASELYQLDAEDVRTWFQAPDMLSDDECAALEAALATVPASLLATQEDLPVSFSEDASSEFTTHHGDTSSSKLPQGMDLEQDVTHGAVGSLADRRAPGHPSEPGNDDFGDNYDAEEFEYINASLAAAGVREDICSWAAYHQLPDHVAHILMMQGFRSASELCQLDAEDVRTLFQAPDMLSDDECAALEAALATVPASLLATQEDLPVSFSEDASSEFTTHHGDTSSKELPQGMDLEQDVTHGAVGSLADHWAPGHPSESGNDDFGDNYDEQETEYINASQAAAGVREDVSLEYCSPVPSHSAAAEVGDYDDFTASTCGGEQDTVRFLLAGKTGCGKSTTGNTILAQNLFNTAPDFGSVTKDCERQVAVNRNTRIEIMDLPGLYDTKKSHEKIGTIIVKAVAGMHPGPHAILYVIKVGRFTPEEYAAYGRLKALFDDSITRHIILLFTHGDQLEREGKTLQELIESPNTPDNLPKVLEECGHRYVLFNNMATDTQSQVDTLLRQVQILVHSNGGQPYICPKYSKIGESLEEEVNKRMEAFEKKDLQRQKYVQELERQTKDAETAAELAFREFEELERQREMEERRRERQKEETERELQKLHSQQEHDTQKHCREVEQLRKEKRRQEAELDRLRREHEKERQRERKERDRTYQAIERDRQRMREEERRRNRAREEEMERLRAAIVQNQEQGFLYKAVGFIGNVITLVLLFL